jgi:chitinase
VATAALCAIGPVTSAVASPLLHPGTGPAVSTHLLPGLPLPLHVAAPYLDVTSVPSIADTAKASGNKYVTLAFLQAPTPGSCDLTWAGDTTKTVAGGAYASEIAKIRRSGGDVIPSFGGYSADTDTTTWTSNPANLTEIADSCTDVGKIAQAYESVVTTYGVHRLDFDIESDSINNTAGVDRRNAAIAEVEQWALRTHRLVEFSYTLPSTPQGLAPNGVAVLRSAAAHHAVIRTVNLMTFDYWDGVQHDMVADAESAATALLGQLKVTTDPRTPTALLWNKVGVIQMNGIDDFGTTETLTPAQAKTFETWAARHHLGYIGFWALERDHEGTPDDIGVKAGYDFSGVAQSDWAFSHAFEPFTSWWL